MNVIGKNRGKKDSGRHLDGLYARQNSLCFWCKSQTVLRRHIPDEAVTEETGNRVTWREGPFVLTARIASLEHVDPIRNGPHAHRPDNFVMACVECNVARTKTVSPTPDRIRRVCPRCGGPKVKQRRLCGACFSDLTDQWLAGQGWQRVPSREEGYFKWINPETVRPTFVRAPSAPSRRGWGRRSF